MTQTINLKNQVKQYADHILLDESFHDKLAPAITGLSELLITLSDITSEENFTRHMGTSSGNAIGPFWAAACSREIFRTQRFIKGLHRAIADKLQSKTSPVQVMYAGTGPFALLALPIMMQYTAEQVQFTFLEINPISYEKMINCLSALDLNEYVHATHCVDASKWHVPNTDIDILLSETMYNGLYREPQVSIMLNLMSQLKDDCVMIPQQIEVCIEKTNTKNKNTNQTSLMRFDRSYITAIIQQSTAQQWSFPIVPVDLSPNDSSTYHLTTDIQIYKKYRLTKNESSLNIPRKFAIPKTTEHEIKGIQYKVGEVPSFHLV